MSFNGEERDKLRDLFVISLDFMEDSVLLDNKFEILEVEKERDEKEYFEIVFVELDFDNWILLFSEFEINILVFSNF